MINSIFNNLALNLINFFNNNLQITALSVELTAYVKICSAIINVIILTLLFLFVLNTIFNFFFIKNSKIYKLFKFINMFFLIIILFLLFIKLFLSLKLEQTFGILIYDIKYDFYKNNNHSYYEFFIVFSSSFSDVILILAFITGFICVELMGFKNLFKNINNLSIFYVFVIFVTIMVTTNNLLVMYLSFEFIFFPTIYFVYKLAYSKKSDKANESLYLWTLFGSFLVLCVLAYIFNKFNNLNYIYLSHQHFSSIETKLIFILILLGFGIKIPIAPFHFWLLKVHVEAPTALSIFLSGFLVKSSLYCLFMFLNLFNVTEYYFFFTCWILYSLIIATIGLAKQIDLKRLIAWATVQEMTFMLLFIIFKQILLTHTCILFLLLHGLLSTYMFYIVDILQRRFKTRSVQFIKGLHLTLPKMTKHIWFLIFIFSGFPLTAKFFIEWSLISLLIESNMLIFIYIIVLVNFLGTVFFCRIMFIILFGVHEKNTKMSEISFIETQKKEYSTLNTLVFFLLILTLLIYIF